MSAGQKKVILGAEHDGRLRELVLDTLHELGAEDLDRQHGIAGSQELEMLSVIVSGSKIVVEAETYIGLSISGSSELVDQISKRVREKIHLG